MLYHMNAYRVGTGESEPLVYDTERHLFTLAGEDMRPPQGPPPHGSHSFKQGISVRLALGHRCNFSCAYCSQCKGHDRKDALDPSSLAQAMHEYYEGMPVFSMQYWGGEPMVYLDYIKKFHEAFKELRKETSYGTSSNGSLLTENAITDWFLNNDISIAFSHDGPGQVLRGTDLLRNPVVRENLGRLHERGMTHLQPTMHQLNPSLGKCLEHIGKALDGLAIPAVAAKLINVYEPEQMALAIPVAELGTYTQTRYMEHLQGIPLPVEAEQGLKMFMQGYGNPATPGLGCHVMDKYTMVIDTAGNILTCQNFTADDVDEGGDPHKLGSIISTTYEKHHPLPELTRLRERDKKCKDCLVYRLCKGGCAYTSSQYMAYNCKARYHENLVTLGLAFTMMTEGQWLLGPAFGEVPNA